MIVEQPKRQDYHPGNSVYSIMRYKLGNLRLFLHSGIRLLAVRYQNQTSRSDTIQIIVHHTTVKQTEPIAA